MSAERDAVAAELVARKQEFWRMVALNAQRADLGALTGAHLAEVIAFDEAIHADAERFRRRWFPRRHRAIVYDDQIMTASRTLRSMQTVFGPLAKYPAGSE